MPTIVHGLALHLTGAFDDGTRGSSPMREREKESPSFGTPSLTVRLDSYARRRFVSRANFTLNHAKAGSPSSRFKGKSEERIRRIRIKSSFVISLNVFRPWILSLSTSEMFISENYANYKAGNERNQWIAVITRNIARFCTAARQVPVVSGTRTPEANHPPEIPPGNQRGTRLRRVGR